ncbi:peptidoglycan-binding protein [Pedobacter frigoris]|uniref:peptidoglycan-binding protein n=1 Tax=Pedobacter frigoris TaxID=2571272 RepID=UPI00292F2C81|nr:peptidoglycan-binding protein [Pedobacter frigoris]
MFIRKFKKNEYETIIGIARKEIGVVERTGRNDGERIAEYLAYCNIKSPAPYCAAWVSWVFGQAGYSLPRTAWSPALFPKGRVLVSSLAKAISPRGGERNREHRYGGQGLVYGIWFTKLNRIGHCGIVESLKGDWINGIEANTNVQGSREGDGVWRRIRHRRTIHCFADWLE